MEIKENDNNRTLTYAHFSFDRNKIESEVNSVATRKKSLAFFAAQILLVFFHGRHRERVCVFGCCLLGRLTSSWLGPTARSVSPIDCIFIFEQLQHEQLFASTGVCLSECAKYFDLIKSSSCYIRYSLASHWLLLDRRCARITIFSCKYLQ